MSATWIMGDLGVASLGVGIKVGRQSQFKYWMCQSCYTDAILQWFDMSNAKLLSKPFPSGLKLFQATKNWVENFDKLKPLYQEVLGSIIYLAQCSRPDHSHSVRVPSQHLDQPGTFQRDAAMHFLRYMQGTTNLGSTWSGFSDAKIQGMESSECPISCYTANWAGVELLVSWLPGISSPWQRGLFPGGAEDNQLWLCCQPRQSTELSKRLFKQSCGWGEWWNIWGMHTQTRWSYKVIILGKLISHQSQSSAAAQNILKSIIISSVKLLRLMICVWNNTQLKTWLLTCSQKRLLRITFFLFCFVHSCVFLKVLDFTWTYPMADVITNWDYWKKLSSLDSSIFHMTKPVLETFTQVKLCQNCVCLRMKQMRLVGPGNAHVKNILTPVWHWTVWRFWCSLK